MTAIDLRVISLGAGVQSTAMYVLAARGELPVMPDCAIFADTQQEPPWVYEQVEHLKKTYDIPIHVVTAGDLGHAVKPKTTITEVGRYSSVPFWVRGENGNETPGRRQCTHEFKIAVITKAIRRLLGLPPRARAAGRYIVENWIGISIDEVTRAKPNRVSWITNRWPLLFDRPMHRAECRSYLESIGEVVPEKSACVFCPYRGTTEWLRWKQDHPDLFEQAAVWDDTIRSSGRMLRGMRSEQYVSRQLVPLREITPVKDDHQINLFENECEGMCGV